MDYTEERGGKYVVRIYLDGSINWLLNGLLHREDGPAVIHKDGSNEWWMNGKRHRYDGPAIEYVSGNKEWWLNDKLVYCNEEDYLSDYDDELLSDEFKKSIILYKLKQ